MYKCDICRDFTTEDQDVLDNHVKEFHRDLQIRRKAKSVKKRKEDEEISQVDSNGLICCIYINLVASSVR